MKLSGKLGKSAGMSMRKPKAVGGMMAKGAASKIGAVKTAKPKVSSGRAQIGPGPAKSQLR